MNAINLNKSVEQFFDLTQEFLCITDLRGLLIKANKSFHDMFGDDTAQNSLTFFKWVHPEDIFQVQQIFQSLNLQDTTILFSVRSLGRDKQFSTVQWQATSVRTNNQIFFIAKKQDTSNLKQPQELDVALHRIQSFHIAKLLSLGELSAGIAHEINNPLSIISGATQILASANNEPEKVLSRLNSIQRAVDRISKIINGLKIYSQSYVSNLKSTYPVSTIFDEIIFVAELRAKKFQTTLKWENTATQTIYCNLSDMHQLLIHLIDNSIEAASKNVAKWVHIRTFDNGSWVIFQVIDSGNGIQDSHVEKIFDPFYTTKPFGEGVGLGLSIAKGIVASHKGLLSYNKLNGNTCFEVQIPSIHQNSGATHAGN